jgi:hypothetical protein
MNSWILVAIGLVLISIGLSGSWYVRRRASTDLKHLSFVAAQFFILSLSFSLFFDPIGISYFLIGLVYMLSRKLAIFEVVIVFFLKGEFAYAFTAPAWTQSLVTAPNLLSFKPVIQTILWFYIPIAFLFGAILAVQTSAKIVKSKLRKKAPDLLGKMGNA